MSRPTARQLLLATALGLVVLGLAAGHLTTRRRLPAGGRHSQAKEFQHLVGGLGFGPAVDLSGCAFGFDPRLDANCAFDRGLVPGGACFCPRHAGSLFSYPPLRRKLSGEEGDGPPD